MSNFNFCADADGSDLYSGVLRIVTLTLLVILWEKAQENGLRRYFLGRNHQSLISPKEDRSPSCA